jgi:hypothetical protein
MCVDCVTVVVYGSLQNFFFQNFFALFKQTSDEKLPPLENLLNLYSDVSNNSFNYEFKRPFFHLGIFGYIFCSFLISLKRVKLQKFFFGFQPYIINSAIQFFLKASIPNPSKATPKCSAFISYEPTSPYFEVKKRGKMQK